MSVEADFAGGPGHTPANELVDGEALREYLDNAISGWRAKRDAARSNVNAEYTMATHYVDAFQSVRASVFGEILKS